MPPEEQPSPPDIIYLDWWDEAGLANDLLDVAWDEYDVTGQGVKYEQTKLQTKLTDIQRELDHILGEKTPTEMRIGKILKGE